jgi:hypothetical protein
MPDDALPDMIGLSENRCRLSGLAARLRRALTERELRELALMLERRRLIGVRYEGQDRRRSAA